MLRVTGPVSTIRTDYRALPETPPTTASEHVPRRTVYRWHSLRRRGCIMRAALINNEGHDGCDGAWAVTRRAIARRPPPRTVMVNLADWAFCQHGALLLRGGDFAIFDRSCVRGDGSDSGTVLGAVWGVVYILRSVPTVMYRRQQAKGTEPAVQSLRRLKRTKGYFVKP